jgi:hypothetical protein
MFKIRLKACCNLGRTSQGDVVPTISPCLSILASAPILYAPQQTEKSGAKFKILNCSKQTLSPFPQQCTLAYFIFLQNLARLWVWTLLLRQLVVASTTKPNLGHLAPASEVAGGHTIPYYHHALFKMVRYVFLRPLRPELDGQYSVATTRSR